MTIFLKKFSFWLILFSILICLFNLSGNDDYNILIFFTNPITLLLADWVTNINTNPDTTYLFRPIIYLSHLVFWGLVGLLIDLIRVRVSENRKK